MKWSGCLFSALLFTGTFFVFGPSANAQATNQLSRPYGLIVHNKNQDETVPRIKVLEVILKYYDRHPAIQPVDMAFQDIPENSRVEAYVQEGCDLGLFRCSGKYFFPYRPINQHDFLKWFFRLKYHKNPDFLTSRYPKIKTETLRSLREARYLNLLTQDRITYRSLQQFLYRNGVAEANLNQPFSYILTVDFDDINLTNYHNPNEIDVIQGNLKRIISNLEAKKNTSKEIRYLRSLKKQVDAFEELKQELATRPYILHKRPDLDPAVTRAVRTYSLQEVLYSYSYDYSRNAVYRQHNLLAGVKKIHGRVFQPGEIINFWKILTEKGLWEFRYGWVIAGGGEEWQFGGGICGSSSLVFLPSWKAGLEILERAHHSKYFTYLYPIEDVGLDATVYRPRPNLKIRNNTLHSIVFNVVDDKENKTVTVEVIGNSPYREIRIEGPVFVGWNHVKWVRYLEDFSGKVVSDILESRYSAIY